MNYTFPSNGILCRCGGTGRLISYICKSELVLAMKLSVVFLIIAMQVSATALSQQINLKEKNTSLAQVLGHIKQQSGYMLLYNTDILQNARPVTINLKNASLEEALTLCLKGQPFTFEVQERTILIKPVIQISNTKLPEVAPKALINVKGRVTDGTGSPVPGVSVKLKNSNIGTSTDVNGEFSINIPDDKGILIITSIGFDNQEVSVDGRKVLNIQLKESNSSLNEVVVVGYGTQTKATVTGSVSSITSEELNTARNSDMINLMAGKLPGLTVAQKTGEPGDYSSVFDIRGYEGAPLVVVDGIPRDNFRSVDPNSIESISVLKDAAAAVYGVRAANGVIVITTKSGKPGKTTFTYSGDYGLEQIITSPDATLNAYQVAVLKNETSFNAGFNSTIDHGSRNVLPQFNMQALEEFQNGTRPSTTWGSVGRRDLAPRTNHSLTASGGTEKALYFFSLGYLRQQGVWKSGDLNADRYNFNSNITANVAKDLKAEFKIAGIQDTKNEPGEGTMRLTKAAWMQDPTLPVYANNNPEYLGFVEDLTHPLASDADISGYRKYVRRSFTGIFALDYTAPFLRGLSGRFQYSYDTRYDTDKRLQKKYTMYKYDAATQIYEPYSRYNPSRVFESLLERREATMQGSLQYSRAFAKHELKGLVLFEQRKLETSGFNGNKELLLDVVDHLYAGTANGIQLNSNGNVPLASQRVIGRVNYDFNDKYLLEASFAYDGSSKFIEGSRWGFFPGISGGWRVSEEKFLKNKLSFLNDLKLRASWGRMGDENASNFQWLTGYVYPQGNYLFGSQLLPGLGFQAMANPYLTWYQVEITNLGIDADLWKGKLHAEFDVFKRRRSGLLDRRTTALPLSLGSILPEENLNTDEQNGFEILLRHSNNIGKVQYSISGNAQYARSKWIEDKVLPAYNNSFLNWRDNPNNRWKSRYLGYNVIGQFQSQEEIFNSPIQDGAGNRTLLPGDLKYEDWNNDGLITTDDRYMVGRNLDRPEISGGLFFDVKWKAVDLNLHFMGATSFFTRYSEHLEQPLWWERGGLSMFWDRWHREDPTNPNSKWIPGKYPSTLVAAQNDRNHQASNYWLRDASYLRLKSLDIGYTIPQKLLKNTFRSVRIYATGYNLLTFSKIDFIDPEQTNASFGYLYPITKNYHFGISAGF